MKTEKKRKKRSRNLPKDKEDWNNKEWDKQLWKLVSKTIRIRDNYTCVQCGRQENNNDCGHLITRIRTATKFNPENLFCQCKSCNKKHSVNPHPFTIWFMDRYGEKKYRALEQESKKIIIRSSDWYERHWKFYTQWYERLEVEKDVF